jgi:Flp pilus assembly protein TadG
VVETALIISVLVFLIFGIVEFGMALWNWNTMVLAVEDAGRYVMLNNTCSTSCAVSQMQTTLATAPGTVSTTCTTPAADQICLSASTPSPQTTPPTMTLTAAYGFKVIGLSPTYTLTSEATFPLD